METVGQFDHDHPDVVSHRQEGLAQGLLGQLSFAGSLLFPPPALADARQLGQLGDAVDQPGDLGSILVTQILEGDLGVFDGVVEDAGRDHGNRRAEFGQDHGHCQAVVHVGLARGPLMACVRLLRRLVGALEQIPVGRSRSFWQYLEQTL